MRIHVLVDWPASVIVNLDELGGPQFVGSTREAALLLIRHWPVRRGQAFRQALKLCSEALEYQADPKDARDAFVAAAKEADIVVQLH